MKKTSILLMMGMLTLLAIQVFAIDYPKPTAWVNDYASVLSVQHKQELDTLLADFETATTNQIFVCILQNLPADISLKEYVNELFLRWKPGQEGNDNGVLLAIFLDDRALRIEVGYGLEGKLTDAQSKLIIANSIVPSLKQGDYYAGIQTGIRAIIQQIEPIYASQPTQPPPPQPRRPQPSRPPSLIENLAWQEYGPIALFVAFIGGVVIFLAKILTDSNSTSGWSGSSHGWQKGTTHSQTPPRESFFERTKGFQLDVQSIDQADESASGVSDNPSTENGKFFESGCAYTIRDRPDSSTRSQNQTTNANFDFGSNRDDHDKKSTGSSWNISFSSSPSSGSSHRSRSSGKPRSFSGGGGGRSGGGGASGSW